MLAVPMPTVKTRLLRARRKLGNVLEGLGMRPRLFHPSRSSLEAWLRGETDDQKLDAHVSTCKRCANSLERLAGEEIDRLDR